MPLIILGLIVVLGAALLIYYQLGPKVTLKLKNARGGGFGGFGGNDEMDSEDASAQAKDQTDGDSGEQDNAEKKDNSDGKVLFIFGDGEREERPIREDDDKDKE